METTQPDRIPVTLHGRQFWQVLQPNGSRQLVADDGGGCSELEWQEFCRLCKESLERVAKVAKARRKEVRAMFDAHLR